MLSSPPAASRKRSLPKSLLFATILLCALWSAAELAASLALWWIDDRPFHLHEFERERRRVARSALSDAHDERVLDAAAIFARAAFVTAPESGADPRVRTVGSSGSDLAFDLPAGSLETELKARLPVGRYRVRAEATLTPDLAPPVSIAIAVESPGETEDERFRWLLEPGLRVGVNRTLTVRRDDALLVVRARRPQGADAGEAASVSIDGLRLVQTAGEEPADPDERPRWREVIHPYLGFTMRPGHVTRDFRLPEKVVASEYGFMDSGSPLRQASEGTLVVGILGGSVADLFSRVGERSLAQRLRESERFSGFQVSFVRAGLMGGKQPQQLMALAYLLSLGAHFDAVINIDGFNEVFLPIDDHLLSDTAPSFPRQWLARVADRDPTMRLAVGRVAVLEEARSGWSQLVSGSWLRRLPSVNLVWRLLDRVLGARIAGATLSLPSQAGSLSPGMTGPTRSATTEAEFFQELVAIWESGSMQLSALCEGNRIPYFHFLQPNQYAPGSGKPLSNREREIAHAPTSVFARSVERGYPLLRDAGRRLSAAGVEYHDLTATFDGVEENIYYDECCHFNQLGNELMADAIAKVMRARWTPTPTRNPSLPARPVP